MFKKKLFQKIVGVLLFCSFHPFLAVATVPAYMPNKGFPVYKKKNGVGGKLTIVGSDSLSILVTFWNEAFSDFYPNVKIQFEGKGSATAPPALSAGVAQLGPMSRPMTQAEKADILGHNPKMQVVEVAVALDALAVYVNYRNPLNQITLAELDGIFSSTFKSGHANVKDWGDLSAMSADWKSKGVQIYGRNSASGTYGFFKDHVLLKGDFKSTMKERPGSSSVVQSVESDEQGIGFSSLGFMTSEAKPLKIVGKDGLAYNGEYQNVVTNKYPLSRLLYIYVLKPIGKKMDPLPYEFLKMVLSAQGQKLDIQNGSYPLTKAILEENLKKIE